MNTKESYCIGCGDMKRKRRKADLCYDCRSDLNSIKEYRKIQEKTNSEMVLFDIRSYDYTKMQMYKNSTYIKKTELIRISKEINSEINSDIMLDIIIKLLSSVAEPTPTKYEYVYEIGNGTGYSHYLFFVKKNIGDSIYELMDSIGKIVNHQIKEKSKNFNSLLFALNEGRITMDDFSKQLK